MKKLIASVMSSILFVGCFPMMMGMASVDPPYPNPDDVTRYDSGDYHIMTYIYKCRDGKYLAITYENKGSGWLLRDTYESAGICP